MVDPNLQGGSRDCLTRLRHSNGETTNSTTVNPTPAPLNMHYQCNNAPATGGTVATVLIHSHGYNGLVDPVTNIDPPEGFEPSPESPTPPPPPIISDVSTLADDSATYRPSSSTSSHASNTSSSLSTSSSNGVLGSGGNQRTGTRTKGSSTQTGDGNNDDSNNSSERNGDEHAPSSALTSRTGPSSEPTFAQASTSQHSNVTNSTTPRRDEARTTNKEASQSTSSSPYRIVSGLNSIYTKITKVFTNSPLSMISTDRCLQEDIPSFAFAHKRTLEKTWKLMDKVVKCCQRPRMNLNNSPPFILEILPETYQHLKLIHTKYTAVTEHPLNDDNYSHVFLKNLQNRCKQTLRLFKEAREDMYDVESEYRHKLTRNTLVFNHILSELKAIFPNGNFIGDKYLITKKESAGDFWKTSFGASVMVEWKCFYHALQKVHSIDSSFFSLHALKQTIDLTCDDYISIFEFDVFTRLFQPWSTLLRNWQILAVTHPGYKAFLTYDELKARLQKHIDKPGSYVYRLSCTKLGQWAIGYVTPDRQILQTIVQNISLSQALTETKFYLYPDGKEGDPSLSELCSAMAGDERNVTVTEEQYEIYCGVGNSFQLCKICFVNDKDIRVEPCNHLLCTSCLIAWQESEGQGCPYCRTEIKETVQITMDLPPKSSSNNSNAQ